jgi:hypothetical protein
MEQLNLNRHTDVKPNAECYKYVLQAISNSKPKFFGKGGNKVSTILSTMEADGLHPDSACYSHAIRIWCNASQYNESPLTQRFEDAIQAQAVLKQMHEMYHRSGSVEVRPTTYDYNNVIRALSRCNINGAVERVEELLTKMENKYHDGDALLMPDRESYMTAIFAWKNSPDVGMRVDGARAIFERMIKQYKNGNHSCKPTVESYNALITLCRNHKFVEGTDEDRRKAFECVVDTVNKMRLSEEIEFNSMTYNLLLYVFGTLLEKGSKEQGKVIESTFQKCCADGLVDDKVLTAIQRVAPYDVYRRCVLYSATKDSTEAKGLYLPEEWSANIIGARPVIPFSMDGNFTNVRNKELSERKMRRLRTRKNQRILQGGRM